MKHPNIVAYQESFEGACIAVYVCSLVSYPDLTWHVHVYHFVIRAVVDFGSGTETNV